MAVKNGDEFKAVATNPVGDEVMGVRDDQLPGTKNSAGPADVGLGLKEFNRCKDALGYECGILFRIFCDAVSKRDQVLDRLTGPDDFHFGALISPALPQLFSHFETFSWLTDWPESSSLMPL